MDILLKRVLALIILFVFCLGATLAWSLIANAYIKRLSGVEKVTGGEFWAHVFIFYIFMLFVFFIISFMFLRRHI